MSHNTTRNWNKTTGNDRFTFGNPNPIHYIRAQRADSNPVVAVTGLGLEYPEDFADINAEAAVLGSLIVDTQREYIGPVRAILRDEFYFSKSEHRYIYNAIISLYENGSGTDCLLLKSELEKQQRLIAAGGVDYLIRVAESTPTKANAVFYATKVLEKYKQRMVWDLTRKQQVILKSSLGWGDMEKDLLQAAKDYQDCLPAEPETITLLSCRDIPTAEILWLWPNRIPSGMFNLMVGDPGIGKSFLSCYMSSVLSTGKDWPDGTAAPSGSVFLFCDEDDFGKVIVPRLNTNGADTSKVYCLNELLGPDDLFHIADPDHLQKLEKAIEQVGDVRLIIFDPITSYLGGVNANSNAEVRAALGGLVRMAQRTNVCIIGISHLNKKSDLDAMYRSLGSMGFVAQARSVWGVVKDKADNTGETKIFSPIKSNLSVKVKGLSYQIEEGRLVWGTEAVEESIDQSLRESPAIDEATDFLLEILSPAGKIVEQNSIMEQAKERNIAQSTLKRAKKSLKITSTIQVNANNRCWFWKLPEYDDNKENA
jgi:putative DNA primase/helicase